MIHEKNPNNAIILAAGLGSRLKSHTSNVPKAMVRYQNKEIISYQIENLKELEINNILVVTGYLSNKLISHIEKRFSNIQFIKNERFSDTNSAFSFSLTEGILGTDSYIHINCDILFSKKLLQKIN